MIKRIVIARPERPFADALGQICADIFTQSEIIICNTGQDAVSQIDRSPVDLLLLSLNFADIGAIEILQSSSQNTQTKHLLVFVEHRFKPILTALRTARVNAIIDTQTESLNSVQKALEDIDKQEVYISPHLRESLLSDHQDPLEKSLTSGEVRVLQIIGTGCDNAETARILNLKESTVQTHRRNIMRKLHISTSAKLVREAIRLGYVRITDKGILPKTTSLCQKVDESLVFQES